MHISVYSDVPMFKVLYAKVFKLRLNVHTNVLTFKTIFTIINVQTTILKSANIFIKGTSLLTFK